MFDIVVKIFLIVVTAQLLKFLDF